MKVSTIVMAGPLPPIVGGMASVVVAFRESSLSRQVDLRLVQTGKTTPEGRTTLQGVRARFGVLADWWASLSTCPRPVAHIHTCSGLTYFLDGILLLVARMRGSPVVLHIHGGRFDAFLDNLDPVRRTLARCLARCAHIVVVLSDEWQQRLAARLPRAHFAVIPNGVPFPVYRQRLTPSFPGDVRFLFVGSLGRGKGVDVLVEAASLSRLPWKVELAGGEGEPGFEAWLRERIKRLGLGERVRLLGPVVDRAKEEAFQSAHGFVLPSLAEGLPMAMLEAMAAGLPVVVTPVGAIPEIVRDGVEGCLVPVGDAPRLAEALDRLASDSAAMHRMGGSARSTCEDRYGVERMVEALWSAYRCLPMSCSDPGGAQRV